MMETKPPYRISPTDETTQERMDKGEVVVGDFLTLMTMKKKLTQQDRNKAKRERRRAKEVKRGR